MVISFKKIINCCNYGIKKTYMLSFYTSEKVMHGIILCIL